MTEPIRSSNGVAFLTFDATLNTDASMIVQQKLDLSGNATARTFCVDAFNLALGRDISGSLLTDSEITDYESNNLVYLGSNDVNEQKTFLSSNINSTKSLNQMCNAYDMTLGKNNQIPIVSYLESEPEPEPEPEPIPEPEPEPEVPIPPFSQLITETKIVASDREASDYFGFSVAIDGNYAIVGAYFEDHQDANGANFKNNAGSAYIFERDTSGNWSQKPKIVANDREAYDRFGQSVAISGNYAIVGAHNEDPSNKGAAYIFEKDTDGSWNQVQKIVASDRARMDFFGESVAIDGNYAIVGAYGKDIDGQSNAGSAYIFERNTDGTWNQNETQKIVASAEPASDNFGSSVAISGNYAIVGANGDDTRRGSAYIFEKDTDGSWNEVQKIVANNRTLNDLFGESVAINGNYAIVGAYYNGAGSAYIFEKDTDGSWNQVQEIEASDKADGDQFGFTVAISGNYAIVGARGDDSNRGSSYIFERNTNGTWSQTETKKIVANDKNASDYFGHSVAISGNYAIVGARGDDSNRGSAYIFEG